MQHGTYADVVALLLGGHKPDEGERRLIDAILIAISGQGAAFMRALESAVAEAIKPLPINVDGAIAAILHDLGYAAEAAKLIFIVGRTAGLAAHVMEEYTRERPMRVRIPVVYDGPTAV